MVEIVRNNEFLTRSKAEFLFYLSDFLGIGLDFWRGCAILISQQWKIESSKLKNKEYLIGD